MRGGRAGHCPGHGLRSWERVGKKVEWSGEIRMRHHRITTREPYAVGPTMSRSIRSSASTFAVPPFVAGFVGCLDMDADDVILFDGLYGGPAFGGVVGVEVSGRARDIDHEPSRPAPPLPSPGRPPK